MPERSGRKTAADADAGGAGRGCVLRFRGVLVKRMFRPSDEDLCPSPHKQPKEETQKRGLWAGGAQVNRLVFKCLTFDPHPPHPGSSAAVRTEGDGRGVRRADAEVADSQGPDGRRECGAAGGGGGGGVSS